MYNIVQKVLNRFTLILKLDSNVILGFSISFQEKSTKKLKVMSRRSL